MAMVTISYTSKEGKVSTRVLSLVKQKNGWKIDSCASSGNQEGPHE
jgi:hypothetical protein